MLPKYSKRKTKVKTRLRIPTPVVVLHLTPTSVVLKSKAQHLFYLAQNRRVFSYVVPLTDTEQGAVRESWIICL